MASNSRVFRNRNSDGWLARQGSTVQLRNRAVEGTTRDATGLARPFAPHVGRLSSTRARDRPSIPASAHGKKAGGGSARDVLAFPTRPRPRGDRPGKKWIMKGFVQNLEGLAVDNVKFRRVVYTAKNCQLVLMALTPNEAIGEEVHELDQFFRVEEGNGEAILDGLRTPIRAGFGVIVPAGTKHDIRNTGTVPLKLYTLYSPPEPS